MTITVFTRSAKADEAPPTLATPGRPGEDALGPASGRGLPTWGLLVLCVAIGTAAGVAPGPAVAVAVAVGLALMVASRPPVAAYLWLFATPLVVGIDRGEVVPFLRPNEALLLLLVAALAGRWGVLALSRKVGRPLPSRTDIGFLLLLLTGAALPLLWMVARGKGISSQDAQSASVVVKYYLLFLLFRMAVRTEHQARRCLWAALAAGVVVALLAVLQSLGLFGVPALLATYWAPGDAGPVPGRGSSTIGNPHGAADLLVFNLAIALGLALTGRKGSYSKGPLALAGVFLLGALGSGQVSAVIALLVALLAVGWVLGQLPRIAVGGLLAAPLALLALAPVVAARLNSVDESTGLPSSWSARLDNLSAYFWPQLFEGYQWLLGVQVLPEATGKESWQPVVYIESGHTWFLWIGGLPYLLAFVCFVVLAVRTSLAAVRGGEGAFAVAGVASVAAYSTVFVLTALDPHLFLRGSADLAVPLLALATIGAARRAPGEVRKGAQPAGVTA